MTLDIGRWDLDLGWIGLFAYSSVGMIHFYRWLFFLFYFIDLFGVGDLITGMGIRHLLATVVQHIKTELTCEGDDLLSSLYQYEVQEFKASQLAFSSRFYFNKNHNIFQFHVNYTSPCHD